MDIENGNINDTDLADVDIDGNTIVAAEPDELDVEDTDYRLESTPDKPDGFFVDEKITTAEDYDPDLFSSFQNVSHAERLNQRQFADSVSWWNEAVRKYDVQGEEIRDAFERFASRQDFSRTQRAGLISWFEGILEKSAAQLELARKIAAKAGANKRTESQAKEIAYLLSSKAYKNKGETAVERKAHKKAVSRMLVLTGTRRQR